MAKVNLLTIHYGKCFGAVMQTFATCKMLEEAGHTVKVVNLIHPRIKGIYKSIGNWKELYRELQFWIFKQRYFSKLTKKGYSINSIQLPEADITIVGSDQVWNYDITGMWNYTFFLDFVPSKQKRVALSSSFGKSEWVENQEYTANVKNELSKFEQISVRESTGVKILSETFNLKSVQLLDPTLAYGKFESLTLSSKSKNYIFYFLLNNSADALNIANKIAEELGIKLFNRSLINTYIFNGPRNWLTQIKNSRYVITDSFHGLALSIIFHKQFFVFCADERKFTRLYSLLKLLHLEERYVKNEDDFLSRKVDLLKEIDYTKVDLILNEERVKYQFFLKKI